VGAYAVELYEKWADRHDFPSPETKGVREFLMTAAMLHDVGKVAISDTILRKTEDLTEDERDRIKMHTIYGARLFRHADSPWDKMAAEVALNHHENWDGSGYPGKIEDIHEEYIVPGTGKRELEIPISARIVRVVDVFDSLISKRVYKEAWEEKDVVDFLKWQAGKQFDPELVDLFLDMKEVIESIKKKFLY
jgi:response regulator RpfG family c-di-GMP phosphodiesterase